MEEKVMVKAKFKALAVLLLAVIMIATFTACGGGGGGSIEGKTIEMTILGIGGWLPSALSVEMAPAFASYAKEHYGYDVTFRFEEAPFESIFQKAATSFASQSQDFNIIICDSQSLGALSEPGWIVQLNDIIAQNPELNIDWYSKSASAAYMNYPDGTNNVWGFPEEADVLILYARKDWFLDSANRTAFRSRYGWELPEDEDDWMDIDFGKYEQILEFFTRPNDNTYGVAIQYSKIYDYMTGSLYPFMWSRGEQIWNPATMKVEGVLNTQGNAEGLAQMAGYQRFSPPGALNFDISGIVDAFTTNKVATAFQWAAMGAAMIPPELEGKVWGVVPPGYKTADGSIKRVYSLGGQPWVVNKFNDEDHMRASIDFLKWWYMPETQLEFARRGGSPLVRSVLESPGFDDIQPWFKAYKYMMQDGNSLDFWHVPEYAELLSIQQEGFTAFAAGKDWSVQAARATLDDIARRQQAVLDQ
jgi:multiple sugar transport system substrate-binding protein